MQPIGTKQELRPTDAPRATQSSLSEQLSELRAEVVRTVNSYWSQIEPCLTRPELLTEDMFLSLRAQLGQEWSEMQRRFSGIQAAQPELSLTARAILDDLWHEGPKVFLHGPLEATIWRDSTRSLAGIVNNLFLLSKPGGIRDEQRSYFLATVSREGVLAEGKFDQETFDSTISRVSNELEHGAAHEEIQRPFVTAKIFCLMVEQDYAQYSPAQIACSVPEPYARQALHAEFKNLAKFVLPILVKNSLEAMQASPPDARRVAISLNPKGNDWHVYVEDNGPGLPAQIRENLFQRGWTSNGEGRGFGLELASRFIQGTTLFDRATIGLFSTSDRGTCFEIVLRSPIEIVAQDPEDEEVE